jgi:hypothetical protein
MTEHLKNSEFRISVKVPLVESMNKSVAVMSAVNSAHKVLSQTHE